MKKFIQTLFKEENIVKFSYKDFETLYAKDDNYDAYYLWFFIPYKGKLVELHKQYSEIYSSIKNMKESYRQCMDKNTNCIICLCISDDEYYNLNNSRNITNLDKIICYIEEDINFFKKNVLVYTNKMKEFATDSIGDFESVCSSYLTVDLYEKFKENIKENYKYDFLANLFIKVPFLNFSKFFEIKDPSYTSVEKTILDECLDKSITEKMCKENDSFIKKLSEYKECGDLSEDNELFKWLDSMEDIKDEH
ncbi:hypothetical protein FDC50_15265 [Clostridium botulinum]|nr:hypothetical protein KU41_01105 [Clostridium botulinum]MBY6803372.1 hypothetical protein [Clostridium botulinum]MBY6813917.1 hypothetical protein [Clostridium botulinum]MBY6820142.1 hypothetical protein [Clostridium botulinum]NFJ52555.1 hypothetical protein [Clostridium botulinum]